MSVHASRRGPASPRRDSGSAVRPASGTHRAEPRVARGQAVSLESAVAKRRMPGRKPGGGSGAGGREKGQGAPVPGNSGQAANGNGAGPGRLAGIESAASDAAQALRFENDPQVESGRGEATPFAIPDSAAPAKRTSQLKTECPGCGDSGVRTLFRAGDRLYRTTDKSFFVVACKACHLISLEPRPTTEELKQYYPANYWYSPEPSMAAKLEEWWRRFVLRDHVNFVARALRESGEDGIVL